jgi:DNA-binding MarR family transcriptional regulator
MAKYNQEQLDAWRSYATVRQLEYIKAIEKNNYTGSSAANELGINPSTINRSLDALKY